MKAVVREEGEASLSNGISGFPRNWGCFAGGPVEKAAAPQTFPFKFKSVASARAGERARTMVCKGKPR